MTSTLQREPEPLEETDIMTPLQIAAGLNIAIVAYFLGSIPWGLILARAAGHDIRREGSGNIGATNVRRVAGTPLGVITLILDIAKGAVPAILATRIVCPGTQAGGILVSLVILLAILGHIYPVFLRFREGGKGVATAAGGFLAVSPAGVLVALLVFVLLVCMTSRVSVGSLAAVAALPMILWEATGSGIIAGAAACAAILIAVRHRDNIRRLIDGTEPPAV